MKISESTPSALFVSVQVLLGKTVLILTLYSASALNTTGCLYYFGRSDPKVNVVVLLPNSIMAILALFVQLYQINELEGHASFLYQCVLIRHFTGSRAITLHPWTMTSAKKWMKGFIWNLDRRRTTTRDDEGGGRCILYDS